MGRDKMQVIPLSLLTLEKSLQKQSSRTQPTSYFSCKCFLCDLLERRHVPFALGGVVRIQVARHCKKYSGRRNEMSLMKLLNNSFSSNLHTNVMQKFPGGGVIQFFGSCGIQICHNVHENSHITQFLLSPPFGRYGHQ